MAKAKITKRFVDMLVPTERVQYIYDDALAGFGIRQMPSGKATYFVEYRPGGGGRRVNKKRMSIGSVGTLAPDEARRLARTLLADVQRGLDPLADRQTRRRELTVQELIAKWDTDNPPGRRSGKPLAPRTKDYMLARLRNHVIPLIGSKRVSEISVAVVNDMLLAISRGETKKSPTPSTKKRGRLKPSGGDGAARKVASDLSIVMAYAVEKGIVSGNPVTGARKPRAGKRHSYLTADQVLAIGTALRDMEQEGYSKAGIDGLRLILLTGARPSEIEQLKWTEVDLSGRRLQLRETKTGYSSRPLSEQAAEILRSRRAKRDNPFVFPSEHGAGYFTSSKKLWNEARRRANLPTVVRYDARHMVATLALSAGHDIASVAAIMGHANPRTTLAIYSHVVDQASRSAAEDVAARVAEALGPAKPLPRRPKKAQGG